MLIKLSKSDGHVLRVAEVARAAAAIELNKHEKAVKAAKVIIDRELQNLRGVDHGKLPDKEVLLIQVDGEAVLKIERKSSQRLNAAALGAAHPDLVIEFTGPSVASYFSNLLQ